MSKETFIAAQLRESAPYLRDAGFRETAKLLLAAADEIEALRSQLEHATPPFETEEHRANENEVTAGLQRKIG